MINDKDKSSSIEDSELNSEYFGINDQVIENHIDGKETLPLPELGEKSEFDKLIDEQNNVPEVDIITEETKQNLSEKELKKLAKKEAKAKKKKQEVQEQIEKIQAIDNTNENEAGLSKEQEAKIEKINAKDNKQDENEIDVQNEEDEPFVFHGEEPRFGLHYVNANDVDVDAIKPFAYKGKSSKNTQLFINTKLYNRFIEYSPSDFTPSQIRDLFIDFSMMNLPNDSGFKIKLFPNDAERTIRVEVYLDRFYRYGKVVEKRTAFAPFWVTGFGESILYASTARPIEKHYRVNRINTFAYRETTKILNKKISAKYITLARDKNATEQDFQQAQALKNSYIEHHINRLNMINTIEWECVPDLYVDWNKKAVVIKLYIKVISTIDYSRLPYLLYVDAFKVNLAELLDIKKQQENSFDDNPRYKKTTRILIDINTIMYLIALNAMYKNIRIFSYNTLYECYKLLAFQVLQKGYDFKQITPTNLSTLKIVDFSKHFVCQKKMFDDRLLHLMNLKSSNEEYYRMKYMYTVQKKPYLLYSDFIVREFEKTNVNDLALLLRNEEEKAWRKRLSNLKSMSTNSNNLDKDFYINNYNVFDYSKHEAQDVETFLMNIIKEDKDEISRIAALGNEVLNVDQRQFFTRKELKELQRTARKLNRIEIKQ